MRCCRVGLTLLLAALAAVPLSPHPAGAEEESQIGLIEVVRITLARNPAIRIAKQDVLEGEGRLVEAREAFLTTFDASVSQGFDAFPLTGVEQDAGVSSTLAATGYSLGVTKRYRSGMTLSPSVSFERTEYATDPDTSGNRASVDFTINLPLLRGSGEEATGAAERAAGADLEAKRLALVQAAAVSVSEAVSAYWDYVAAYRNVVIWKRSEEKAAELLETIRRLVAADERPAVDLIQLRANLTSRGADRITAERDVIQSRNRLASAMGLPAEGAADLGIPATDFPPLLEMEVPGEGRVARLLDGIPTLRADLLALSRSREAAGARVTAARDQLKPRLDVSFSAGLSTLNEGGEVTDLLLPYGEDAVGGRAAFSLVYSAPIGGRAGQGLVLQREAARERTVILYDEGLRQTRAAAASALDDLRMSLRILEQLAEVSRQNYEVLRAEETKLKLGLSTIVDVITADDDYIASLRDELNAKIACSRSIIDLRLATGTIIAPEQDQHSLVLENLTGIP